MPPRIFRNRVFITLDFVGWLVIPVLALALRLDGVAGITEYRQNLLVFMVISVICKFVALWYFGLYRRYWGYASVDEMLLVVISVLAAGVAVGGLYLALEFVLLPGPPRLPKSVPFLDSLLTLVYVGGSRFALRSAMQLRTRVAGHPAREPVLIVGAGDAGMMIAKELRANPQLKLEPVAFVDDDPDKQRSTILGLPVLGPRENLPEIARANGVRQVIIAIPRAPGRMIREIRDLCEGAGLTAKTVPGMFDIISGRVGVSQIRNVQIEDLLRRDAVETDQAAVGEMLEGMTVLVTGAGGSIGSEMCRQIAGFNARQIVLLGHGENSIFEVHNELKAKFTSLDLIPVIADIRNEQRISEIFERLRPQAVFHAAAHKHVPLMEMNPVEAVTNNVGGTQNVLAAAERSGVSHFVLISTDKAVKPSSVMGATKLIAETLVHAAAERTGAVYVSVRFGNVLGSRGSVVPLFQRQIAAGGPVTVTHPEMTRYFMTIPESVQLVLQAAALGIPGSGETFVLDMGEPMKIVQLARDLIHLSGLEEGRDIEITFSGLRPGEKMFEELFLESEDFGRTAHGKVFAARNGQRSLVPVSSIARLTAAAESGDAGLALRLLAEAVPSLRPVAGRWPAVASSKARVALYHEVLRVVLGFGLSLGLAAATASAQQPPPRPPGVTEQQLQQAVQQAAPAATIRQRILQSGLPPAEIRARLQAAGYPATLLDTYMAEAAAAQPGAPGADVSAALAALGMGPLAEAAAESQAEPTPTTTPGPAAAPALRPFGSELFERATSQFQPLLTGPVDPDYRLGPGDQFVLILTGDVELAHQLEVAREGFVVIPQVGQIWVSGLTLAQLTDVLYTRLGRVYSGVRRGQGATTRFQVSISRLRMNQIFVIGEVNRPGAYQVPSVGTLFYALYLAGGPNANGSYRDITLRRGDSVIRTLDVYDYLLRGDNSNDVRLESGDVIFIRVRDRQVGIQGNVVRPALYELRPSDGLRQLVQLAGGVAPDAFVRRVQIDRVLPPPQRTDPGVDRVLLDVDVSAVLDSTSRNVVLEPSDVVNVFAVLGDRRHYVTVRGNVLRPGTYQFTPGMRLWDVIAQTQGVISDVYLERAHILRMEPDLRRRLISVSLAQDSAGHQRENPELADLDEVLIYGRSNFRPERTVTISGSIRRAGRLPYFPGMTLRDVVIAAGGLTDDAYLREAEIARLPSSRANGALADTIRVPLDSTYIVDRDSSRYLGPPGLPGPASGAPEFPLEPFDNVLILRQPDWELQRTVAVAGQVRFPARYALLSREERLADILRRAGGPTPTAYVRGAQLLRSQGGLGRVGLDFERALRDARHRDNVLLFAGDSIFVPEYQPTVKVEGAVSSPVAVAYVPNRSAGYYVDRAGGYARRADKRRTYIVQLSGTVMRRSATVEPGARVVVPEVPAGEGKTDWVQMMGSIATILTSALTIILVVKRL